MRIEMKFKWERRWSIRNPWTRVSFRGGAYMRGRAELKSATYDCIKSPVFSLRRPRRASMYFQIRIFWKEREILCAHSKLEMSRGENREQIFHIKYPWSLKRSSWNRDKEIGKCLENHINLLLTLYITSWWFLSI